jgi:hypothetical protein
MLGWTCRLEGNAIPGGIYIGLESTLGLKGQSISVSVGGKSLRPPSDEVNLTPGRSSVRDGA